jgi:hypothetical protein
MSKADIPTNACWIDIDAFEEEITTVEMIREATQACKVEKRSSMAYAQRLWLYVTIAMLMILALSFGQPATSASQKPQAQ